MTPRLLALLDAIFEPVLATDVKQADHREGRALWRALRARSAGLAPVAGTEPDPQPSDFIHLIP